MRKISIVIPTHNRKNYLKVLLIQLSEQLVENAELQIVVVNDGSIDGTDDLLKREFPHVHVVNGDGNWWITKSLNEGIKDASHYKPDYILCLNDDVEVEQDYLQILLQDINKLPSNAILGSSSFDVLNRSRIILAGAKSIIWWRLKTNMYIKPFSIIDRNNYKGIYHSVTLPARGSLIPYKALIDVNYFDEVFPQYFSDIDFFLRAGKKGYSIFISWNACIYVHLGTASISSSHIKSSLSNYIKNLFNKYSKIHLPSAWRFIRRNNNLFRSFIALNIFIIGTLKAHLFNKKVM